MTVVPEPEGCPTNHSEAYVDRGVYVCLGCGLRAPVVDPARHMEDEAAITAEMRAQWLRTEAKRRLREQDAPPPEFHAVTATEAIAAAGDHGPDWLIESILPAKASVLMTAQHKVGKTTFLQHLGINLVRGRRFLEWAVPRPYPRGYLYINLDESARGFALELEKIQRDEGEPIPDGFRVLNLAPNDLDVSVPASVDALTAHVIDQDAGVVVLDVWGGAYAGDENDNSEVRQAVNNLLTMRDRAELDALIIVHHAGWGEQVRARGASSIEGAVDVLWRYHRKPDENFSRFKSGGRIPPIAEVPVHFDPTTRRIWAVTPGSVGGVEYERLKDRLRAGDATLQEAELVLQAAVTADPGHPYNVYCVTTGGKSQIVRDALRSLTLAGKLRGDPVPGSTAIHYHPYDPKDPTS